MKITTPEQDFEKFADMVIENPGRLPPELREKLAKCFLAGYMSCFLTISKIGQCSLEEAIPAMSAMEENVSKSAQSYATKAEADLHRN